MAFLRGCLRYRGSDVSRETEAAPGADVSRETEVPPEDPGRFLEAPLNPVLGARPGPPPVLGLLGDDVPPLVESLGRMPVSRSTAGSSTARAVPPGLTILHSGSFFDLFSIPGLPDVRR